VIPLSWEDVERHYQQALRSFEELERSKATCLLGTPVSLAKRAFQDRFQYSVENRAGDPKRILREMVRHASDVLIDCAERSAYRIALEVQMKRWGKPCTVRWNWSPAQGKCYIYQQYAPEARPVVDEIKCPREDEFQASERATRFILERKPHCLWIQPTRLGTRLIDPKRYREDPMGVSLDKLVDSIVAPIKEVWTRKREEVEALG
jgi:hypothetical protein